MAKIQALTESRIEELYKKNAMKADQRFKKGTSLPIPNLLVVDDDATVRQQLDRLYTQKKGYSVVAVSSAEEGISRFAEEDIDLAITDITVLVQGETVTGKELVASAIHYQSQRRDGPFVTINCAGFPESLLENELFGHEKGAFTGADHPKPGKIELAHGGTLFLDEIESISVVMQGKLLRVLEDQKVHRLGGGASIHVDMRVIAASNIPLKEMVAEGRMRSDFYYRINVIPIHLVPLRQRKVDIPLLMHDFLRHQPIAAEKGIIAISTQVMNVLIVYPCPGHIRELQNVLERAIVLATGR